MFIKEKIYYESYQIVNIQQSLIWILYIYLLIILHRIQMCNILHKLWTFDFRIPQEWYLNQYIHDTDIQNLTQLLSYIEENK